MATLNSLSHIRIVEKQPSDFFSDFSDALPVYPDQIASSSDHSMTSKEMDDCVTILAMESIKASKYTKIYAYQVLPKTKQREIINRFFSCFDGSRNIALCVVGGIEFTARNDHLVSEIYGAIAQTFGNTTIDYEFINIECKVDEFVSVNIQMNGEITFCKHAEISEEEKDRDLVFYRDNKKYYIND